MAATFTETAEHPIDDLAPRWARTHGPFVVPSIAALGLGAPSLIGLRQAGGAWTLVAGSFVDLPGEASGERRQYRHSQVLALIKRRTPARLRKGVEPVEQIAFARFLAEWQGVGKAAAASMPCWAIEQLLSMPAPWSR